MGYIAENVAGTAKRQWRLVEILFSPALRLTDCPRSIEYGGYTWAGSGLSVGSIQNSFQGPTASLTIPDADQSLFTLLDATNGGEGLIVRIYLCEFAPTNETATPDDIAQLYDGRVLTCMKTTGGGEDIVAVSCGPPAQVSAIDFPSRLLGSLVRTAA